ncbi:MAG: ATP-binding protein [Deltaproteobacteria bacterium]|nr:ATP-binding protein [Deltaproteobacteria bacterium]
MLIPEGYPGRILRGAYSPALREHLRRGIERLENFERLGLAPMLYVAAWHEREKVIWYEFLGQRLLHLLDCPGDQAAARFRSLVLDQRTYSSQEGDLDVHEEIISSGRLRAEGDNLREHRLQAGRMEAIYKMNLAGTSWLKDSSVLEIWQTDGICLSFGCLIDVSKEMEQKDQIHQENMVVHRDKSILVAMERANALNTMAVRLCHEIRNPIASLGGLVKRLHSMCEPEAKMARYLEVVEHETIRLEKILAGFVAYTRTPQLRREPVEPRTLLSSVLSLLKTEMESQGIEPILHDQADLPSLFIDRELMEEALLHVVKNGIEALPGGGTIECFLERAEGALRIRIRDHGAGIQENLRARIFEPFFTTKVYGAGLGLSMADKIIRLHGGTLSLQAGQERGTEAVILLPGQKGTN